jgi:hypothetical protein
MEWESASFQAAAVFVEMVVNSSDEGCVRHKLDDSEFCKTEFTARNMIYIMYHRLGQFSNDRIAR